MLQSVLTPPSSNRRHNTGNHRAQFHREGNFISVGNGLVTVRKSSLSIFSFSFFHIHVCFEAFYDILCIKF